MKKLEDKLAWLAFEFRGTRDEIKRKEIAQEYANVVFELIESNIWNEIPTFEEQLPDEYMPTAYFQYWGLRPPESNER